MNTHMIARLSHEQWIIIYEGDEREMRNHLESLRSLGDVTVRLLQIVDEVVGDFKYEKSIEDRPLPGEDLFEGLP